MTFRADQDCVRRHPVDGFVRPQMLHTVVLRPGVEKTGKDADYHRIASISLLITLLKSLSFFRSVSILRIEWITVE